MANVTLRSADAMKKGELPSKALDTMIVTELKEFLEVNDVELSSVKCSGKTPNRPTRKDLLERATELRKELAEQTKETKEAPKATPKKRAATNGNGGDAGQRTDLMMSPKRGRGSSRNSVKPVQEKNSEKSSDDANENQNDKNVTFKQPQVSRTQMAVLVFFNVLLFLILVGALLSLRGSYSVSSK